MVTPKIALCVVEILRDSEGKVYSQIRHADEQRYYHGVVIDREKGKQFSEDTVTRRATALAALLGLELLTDLRWPCSALEGGNRCRCPECSLRNAKDIGVRHTRPSKDA